MTDFGLVQIVEGAILAAGKPLTVQNLADLFEEHERPDTAAIREALAEVAERCEDRGYMLQEVASGFRFQVRQELSQWIGRLWHERPQKYSRALLETLSLIAYRQPITRGEIEEIRGVAVSSQIIKTLHEREWVRVVGHRDVPGRPAMYATTRQFLDYFNLKSLDQLPALAEIRDFETLTAELGFENLVDETALDAEAAPLDDAVATADAEQGTDAEAATADVDVDVETLPDAAVGAEENPRTEEEMTAEEEPVANMAAEVAEIAVDGEAVSEPEADVSVDAAAVTSALPVDEDITPASTTANTTINTTTNTTTNIPTENKLSADVVSIASARDANRDG
ncbi:SMC-Scp complex subunit ScpB [Halieaceae bacterium IMCC14734]|uniref:SMC-Scp complex subunit ScpB n=1 Tax=Candidatus Litorirhabdus singularis TaxID=2518993 RepID=A0ABT3TFT1_9GAMM|nr:SMC-Scp complex subunit ScpB [Candidatus Litorirhabdus singularis]MCX2981160.1 SMC-Scp complex subunit ScpB [Candidatus Litorirhabdus singularis]